jgi:hypothetical protein
MSEVWRWKLKEVGKRRAQNGQTHVSAALKYALQINHLFIRS